MGYVKTEYQDFTLNVGGELQDFAGNEFPGAPNITATLGINYQHMSGLFVGADINYQDESYVNADHANTREADARALMNAKIGYKQENFEVYLWGSNLTDKEYIAVVFEQNAALSAVQDYATPGEPRMIGASVQFNF